MVDLFLESKYFGWLAIPSYPIHRISAIFFGVKPEKFSRKM
jgi:hypothetical protein